LAIEKHHGPNSGLLSRIWLKLKAEITDTHTPVEALSISEDITLTGTWTQIDFVRKEASYQESAADTEQGDTYSFSVQLTIQKDRQAVSEALFSFMNRELIAIVEDLNDCTRR